MTLKIKLGFDNLSHDKLRFYSQLKSCFAREPYIDKVSNRNSSEDEFIDE